MLCCTPVWSCSWQSLEVWHAQPGVNGLQHSLLRLTHAGAAGLAICELHFQAWCSGSVGAARNKHGLQKAGIKFVLNASPVVPCFHGGCFRYKTVAVYDDVDENIAQHFLDTNAFIDQVWVLS